jgi:DNA-binding response OmpR family regulator
MGTPVPVPTAPRQVALLVVEEDPAAGAALRQVLDSEGWRVRVIHDCPALFAELKSGEYSLIIANVATLGVNSPAFTTLKELCSVPADEGARLRILFLVPELMGSLFVAALEANHLPYVVQPYHFHDFLEKISDLLVEIKVIDAPLRQVRHEFGALRKKKKQTGRSTSMFAARDSFSYSDEEIAEYERQEAEATKNKRNKVRTNLGGGDR